MMQVEKNNIHFDPIVFTVRIYDQGTYKNRDPYSAVMTIMKMEDLAFIFAMQGNITREHWKQILLELKEIGVKELITKRHKQTKIFNVEKYLNKLLK